MHAHAHDQLTRSIWILILIVFFLVAPSAVGASFRINPAPDSVWLVFPEATVITSDLGEAEGTNPRSMIDHDNSTLYWTGRAPNSGDYIQVDLGDTYPVNGIGILMGSHSGPNARPYDYLYSGRVFVSVDGVNWDWIGRDLIGLPEFRAIFDERPVCYIRIMATADQVYWVQVREILVSVPESAATGVRPAWIQIAEAERLLVLAQQKYELARTSLQPFDADEVAVRLAEATQLLEQAKKAYDLSDDAIATDLAKGAQVVASVASSRTVESRPVEVRAAWVDRGILVAGPQSIIETLDRLQQLGINLIYPEVLSKGAAAYPSDIYPLDPEFATWPGDVMAFIVEAAHERGMQVHPWVWVMSAGYYHQMGPIMKQKPEWTELSMDGDIFAPNEWGTAWLNPVLPEVRTFLADAFVELVTKYEVGGIHFDYIRYNEEGYRPFGYSRASLEAFHAATGYDAHKLDSPSAQEAWNNWRANNVTQVVAHLSDRLREVRPDLQISVAVVPDPNEALRETHQDWAAWLEKGWLDHVALMNYTGSASFFNARNELALASLTRGAAFPGIGIWTTTPQGVVDQVVTVQELGAPGIALFAASTVAGETARLLKEGPFREAAISPVEDPLEALESASRAVLREIEQWVELGAVSGDSGTDLIRSLDPLAEAVAMVRDKSGRDMGDQLLTGFESFRNESVRLVHSLRTSEDASAYRAAVADRLMQNVTFLEALLRIVTGRSL